GAVLSFSKMNPPIQVVLVKDAPTKPEGKTFTLAEGKYQDFFGAPVPFHRKQIVVSNRSSAVYLMVYKMDDGTRIGTIFPQSNFTLFSSGPVRVKREADGAGGTVNVD